MNSNSGRPITGWQVCCVIGLLVLSGCHGAVPGYLIGTWVSDDQRYAGRSLRIAPDTITFAASEHNKISGTIRKVKASRQDTLQIVKISYVGKEDTPSTIEIVYSGERGGYFWLRNQPKVVWNKIRR